jgi:hypothetical protein
MYDQDMQSKDEESEGNDELYVNDIDTAVDDNSASHFMEYIISLKQQKETKCIFIEKFVWEQAFLFVSSPPHAQVDGVY